MFKDYVTGTKLLALGVIAAVVCILIFLAGVGFGSHRAFGPQPGGPEDERMFSAFGIAMPHMFVTRGHGEVGTVQSVGSSTLTVLGRDGTARTTTISSTTVIETPNGTTSLADLPVGSHVIIIGAPSSSGEQLYAAFIRLLPQP